MSLSHPLASILIFDAFNEFYTLNSFNDDIYRVFLSHQ